MRGEMAWAPTLRKLRRFFHDSTPRSIGFRAFCRSRPRRRHASINSFMLLPADAARRRARALSRGDGSRNDPRWVGGISGSGNTQWFGEGATTYFTARTEPAFPCR
jgi:hypothetical protein